MQKPAVNTSGFRVQAAADGDLRADLGASVAVDFHTDRNFNDFWFFPEHMLSLRCK